MTPKQAVEFFVTQTAVAKLCGVPHPNVSRWMADGRMPAHHEATLCVASDGELKLSPAALSHGRAWVRAMLASGCVGFVK